MAEHRSAPRIPSKQRCIALLGRTEAECTVRDLSATGARLSFRNPTFLPRIFALRLDGEDHRVTVVWQSGLFAGVRFQTPRRMQHAAPKRRSIFSFGR